MPGTHAGFAQSASLVSAEETPLKRVELAFRPAWGCTCLLACHPERERRSETTEIESKDLCILLFGNTQILRLRAFGAALRMTSKKNGRILNGKVGLAFPHERIEAAAGFETKAIIETYGIRVGFRYG